MTKQRWLGLLACTVFAVAIAVGSFSCSKSKSSNPVGPGTPKELDSGDIAPAGNYSHTFTTAGTFNYHCIYHGVMTGTVTVTAGAPVVDDAIVIVSTAPFPAKAIKVGAKITWTNNTAMTHTVTSN